METAFKLTPMIWSFIAMGLFVAELIVPGLVIIWFAIAALIMILLSFFITSTMLQMIIFIALGIALFIFTRPLAKKYFWKDKEFINHRIIGQETKILKKLEDGFYELKVDGKYWRGKCSEELEVGDEIIVEDLSGNTLIIIKKGGIL